MLTILVLRIHHNGNHDNHGMVPHWARVVFLHFFARLVGMTKYITDDEVHNLRLNPSFYSLPDEDVGLFQTMMSKVKNLNKTKASDLQSTTVAVVHDDSDAGSFVMRSHQNLSKDSSLLFQDVGSNIKNSHGDPSAVNLFADPRRRKSSAMVVEGTVNTSPSNLLQPSPPKPTAKTLAEDKSSQVSCCTVHKYMSQVAYQQRNDSLLTCCYPTNKSKTPAIHVESERQEGTCNCFPPVSTFDNKTEKRQDNKSNSNVGSNKREEDLEKQANESNNNDGEPSTEAINPGINKSTPSDQPISLYTAATLMKFKDKWRNSTEKIGRDTLEQKLEEKPSIVMHEENMTSNHEKLLFNLCKRLNELKNRLINQDIDAEVRSEWQQIAMVLDRVMFFVFIFNNIGLLVVMAISLQDDSSYYLDSH